VRLAEDNRPDVEEVCYGVRAKCDFSWNRGSDAVSVIIDNPRSRSRSQGMCLSRWPPIRLQGCVICFAGPDSAERQAFRAGPFQNIASLSLLPACTDQCLVCLRPSRTSWSTDDPALCRGEDSILRRHGGCLPSAPGGPRSSPAYAVRSFIA